MPLSSDHPKRLRKKVIRVFVTAERKRIFQRHPLRLENRFFPRLVFFARHEALLRIRRGMEEKIKHHFVDHALCAAKSKRGFADRRDIGEPIEPGLFSNFTDRRINERFSGLMFAFWERPSLIRIFDKKNLNFSVASAKDNPTAEMTRLPFSGLFGAAFWESPAFRKDFNGFIELRVSFGITSSTFCR